MTADPFFQFTSDGFADRANQRAYFLRKARVRRRWTLDRHEGSVIQPAAYFRTEQEARMFADALALTITDHREALS